MQPKELAHDTTSVGRINGPLAPCQGLMISKAITISSQHYQPPAPPHPHVPAPHRQPQVLLRGHVAQQGGAQGTNGGSANGGGDVVIGGGNVCGQGAQGVEGRLVTPGDACPHTVGESVVTSKLQPQGAHKQP